MKNNKVFIGVVLAIAAIAFIYFSMMHKKETAAVNSVAVAESELIREHSPKMGPADAKVKFVEFLDPQCEACRALDPMIKGLIKEYDGKVLYVVRYRTFHEFSLHAAMALEEAREQGKFWESLSNLFYNLPQWGSHDAPDATKITTLLVAQGVNADTLDIEKLKLKHKWKIDMDQADADKLAVNMTPTIFINGVRQDDISYESLKAAIQAGL